MTKLVWCCQTVKLLEWLSEQISILLHYSSGKEFQTVTMRTAKKCCLQLTLCCWCISFSIHAARLRSILLLTLTTILVKICQNTCLLVCLCDCHAHAYGSVSRWLNTSSNFELIVAPATILVKIMEKPRRDDLRRCVKYLSSVLLPA